MINIRSRRRRGWGTAKDGPDGHMTPTEHKDIILEMWLVAGKVGKVERECNTIRCSYNGGKEKTAGLFQLTFFIASIIPLTRPVSWVLSRVLTTSSGVVIAAAQAPAAPPAITCTGGLYLRSWFNYKEIQLNCLLKICIETHSCLTRFWNSS